MYLFTTCSKFSIFGNSNVWGSHALLEPCQTPEQEVAWHLFPLPGTRWAFVTVWTTEMTPTLTVRVLREQDTEGNTASSWLWVPRSA